MMTGCPPLGWLWLLAATLCRAATDQNLVPLIVLKNPRSGSSWLVQLLNGVPSAFVTEEILTSKSAGHGDVKAEGEQSWSPSTDGLSGAIRCGAREATWSTDRAGRRARHQRRQLAV